MYKPEISISTSFNYEIPIEEQIPLVAEAGFTHIMISGDDRHSGYLYKSRRQKLKKLLDKHSLKIDTIHGPRSEILSKLDACKDVKELYPVVEAAKDLGVSIIVLHGFVESKFSREEYPEKVKGLINISKELKALGEKEGIIFALENQEPGPAVDAVKETILTLNSPHIGFCYDSSHDHRASSEPVEILRDLGAYTVAVHLSDNPDGNDEDSEHVIPGRGLIDWDKVSKALRESVFSGPLLLELFMKRSSEKEPINFLKNAYESGCWLYEKVFSSTSRGV